MKQCKKCGHTHNNRHCPLCRKAWRDQHREQIRSRNRELYRLGKRDHILKKYKNTLSGQFSRIMTQAKARIKDNRRKVLQFNLDKEYLYELWHNQNGRCAISGLQMTFDGSLKTVSLDRIESSIGYLKTNVQLVCKWVNLAKKNFTDLELKEIIAELVAHHKLL